MRMFKQMTGTSPGVLWRYPETPHMGVKVLSKGQAEWAGFRALPTYNEASSAIISSTYWDAM